MSPDKPVETTTITTMASTSTTDYTCKWGRVFNSENYPVFHASCMVALTVADAWGIVQGTDIMLNGVQALANWKLQRQRAIQIICGSINSNYIRKIIQFIETKDPQAMWNEIAKTNYANDRAYISELCANFHQEVFNPSKESVCQFVE
jgi:hypothetical protein